MDVLYVKIQQADKEQCPSKRPRCEDGRKLRLKFRFCEENSELICISPLVSLGLHTYSLYLLMD